MQTSIMLQSHIRVFGYLYTYASQLQKKLELFLNETVSCEYFTRPSPPDCHTFPSLLLFTVGDLH